MPTVVTSLFNTRPGTVGVGAIDQSLPVMISVGGTAGTPLFDPFRYYAIVTGFSLGSESGMAVTHTLNDAVRAYLFGERAQTSQVNGVTFPTGCGSAPGSLGGHERAWIFYQYSRSSTRLYPVRIYGGPGIVLWGLLRGFRMALEDPVFGTGRFSFDFMVFPNVLRRVRFPLQGTAEDSNPLGVAPDHPVPDDDPSKQMYGDSGAGGDWG